MKRTFIYGTIAGLSLLATCWCIYSTARIGLLALPPAVVFSILFIVFAKIFIRDTIQDRFEIVTTKGVKVIGYDISLFGGHILLVKQGDIVHSVEKRDVNYVNIINHEGQRRLPIQDFLREFTKES